MYLSVYVPRLQYAAGIVGYVHQQLGLPVASTAPLGKITDGFSAAVRRFAREQSVPWVDFIKGQREDEVMHEHLAAFEAAGHREGVLFIGRAQEKTALFRTEKRRDAEYRLSDLYAMRWNPVVGGEDFEHDPTQRLHILPESERAYESGALSEDIRAEQDKLGWADTLVVQFPMWWFGPPAILKGWFDRLFVQGFAQGVLDPHTGRALRYGDGGLAGKRAIVLVTVGAGGATTGPRGIHGDINEILFPLQHGTLWYSGMSVVPPFVVNGANRVSEAAYRSVVLELRRRLLSLATSATIPFRHQNLGDSTSILCCARNSRRVNSASRCTGRKNRFLKAGRQQ
ncbi:MAG: NAD(P)H-dependent oxidoreductase [Streptosporangiaceae bacterium]